MVDYHNANTNTLYYLLYHYIIIWNYNLKIKGLSIQKMYTVYLVY
jgi:hypothetical protein